MWQVHLTWHSTQVLGDHFGVDALKKPIEDSHHRAQCVALISSSCLYYLVSTFKTSNTSLSKYPDVSNTIVITLLFGLVIYVMYYVLLLR
jgi:hypothetical protein